MHFLGAMEAGKAQSLIEGWLKATEITKNTQNTQ